MKFSEQWLRDLLDITISRDELLKQLTMAGLEVDVAEPVAKEFSKVVVGRVMSCEKHPDADKLSVCQVDIAGDSRLQIVCGAPNIRADICVPVATVGAKLPGDFKIKKSKLRGVESQGMICSQVELGLGENSDGIWILPEEAPIGQELREYLSLDGDSMITVELTPNRADCLSLQGIAGT